MELGRQASEANDAPGGEKTYIPSPTESSGTEIVPQTEIAPPNVDEQVASPEQQRPAAEDTHGGNAHRKMLQRLTEVSLRWTPPPYGDSLDRLWYDADHPLPTTPITRQTEQGADTPSELEQQ